MLFTASLAHHTREDVKVLEIREPGTQEAFEDSKMGRKEGMEGKEGTGKAGSQIWAGRSRCQ